jgi:hypothetical protein
LISPYRITPSRTIHLGSEEGLKCLLHVILYPYLQNKAI